MVVDDAECEVEIIEEAVGVVCFWVDVWRAVWVGLWDGVELDEFETEGFGGELLRRWVGAVARAGKKIVAANEGVTLTRK